MVLRGVGRSGYAIRLCGVGDGEPAAGCAGALDGRYWPSFFNGIPRIPSSFCGPTDRPIDPRSPPGTRPPRDQHNDTNVRAVRLGAR